MLCIGLRPNIDKDCRALILGTIQHGRKPGQLLG